MKKLLFIYNPVSGKGLIRQKLSTVVERMTQAGWLVTVCPTQGAGDAERIAEELGGKFDRVVCSGGDGTLSQTVSGLVRLPKPPTLGYIPAGSTNDCARNLRLPAGVEKTAMLAAGGGVLRPLDVGMLNDRPFVYVAAFGAFTDVAYDTPQELKKTFGHLAYVVNGIGQLTNLVPHHLRVESGGEVIEGDFLLGMVCNTYSVGGVKALSEEQVKLDDGLCEVILIRKEVNLADVVTALQALGEGRTVNTPAITSFQAAEVQFTADVPVAWTLDGVYGGSYDNCRAVNRTQALQVVFGK